jgi:hypothetical protein
MIQRSLANPDTLVLRKIAPVNKAFVTDHIRGRAYIKQQEYFDQSVQHQRYILYY